jgi:plasmid stability protein
MYIQALLDGMIMPKPHPAHSLDRIIVRLPKGMREQLQERAKGNLRSMTAEVVDLLQQHLSGPDARLRQVIREVLAEERAV